MHYSGFTRFVLGRFPVFPSPFWPGVNSRRRKVLGWRGLESNEGAWGKRVPPKIQKTEGGLAAGLPPSILTYFQK